MHLHRERKQSIQYVGELIRDDLVVVEFQSKCIVKVDDGLASRVRARVRWGSNVSVDSVNLLKLALWFAWNAESGYAMDAEAL